MALPRRATALESFPMKRVRRRLRDRATGFFADWALPRQLAGASVMAEAAQSTQSRTLRPRLEQADRIGTSICPFCAVGCAQLVYAKDGRPIHIEGDPRSPVNQGTLCPKGAGTLGMLLSEQRVNHVLYRAPYTDHWERKPLDWAMERIANAGQTNPRRDVRRKTARRKGRQPHARESAPSGAPRWTTKRTT